MADVEAKKILEGLWADTGDRLDPDDASLNPVLDRDTGWTSPFSATDGETPRREVFNQRFREHDGAASDAMRYGGVYPYDPDVDYFQYARCSVGLVEYVANVANGPNSGGAVAPTAPGQTTWSVVVGLQAAPSAPAAPQATTPRSGELDWFWNCPLDGGSIITEFDFQWRVAGTTAWSMTVVVNYPRYVLPSLSNGVNIEAQVRARNANGNSPWSLIGTAAARGTIPEGGSQLALRATAGDGEVELDWLEPDNGGIAITSYTVQWRADGQAFSSGREQTATTTEATVGSLTNGTEYFFQVRATNSEGHGNWSNEAPATPMAVVVPPPPPANEEPGRPAAPVGTARRPLIVDWSWELVDDDGGRDGATTQVTVLDYDFQWRLAGQSWSGNLMSGLDETCASITLTGTATAVEARVRARNSVGYGDWSPTGTVAAASLLGAFPHSTRYSSDQTLFWPYPDASRAVLHLHAESGAAGRDTASDFAIQNGYGNAMAGLGDTLWISEINPQLMRGYVNGIATRTLSTNAPHGINAFAIGGTHYWRNNTTSALSLSAYRVDNDNANAALNITPGGTIIDADCDGTHIWVLYSVSGNRAVKVYRASDGAEDSTRAITLPGLATTYHGIAVSGSLVYVINDATNTAEAYLAANGNASTGDNIALGTATHREAGATDTALYVRDVATNTVHVWQLGDPTTVTIAGTTYSTAGTPVGDLWQPVTGLAHNTQLAIDVDTGGYVDIYAQA